MMKVTQIPFVNLVGIEQKENNLSLEYKNDILNHIQTIHASAQFTLAETQSGLYLQELFPELKGQVIPILRDSTMKFKKPALKKIFAYANISEENLIKFKEQFNKKKRATIEVNVEIKDTNNTLTSQASFTWFIQELDN
jgi:acyl-coenzyme A thioesterase PaaI-like protein